ncbi:MAG: o-succinylbenzoate synthase [Cyanobacteria bacterium P01_A01_bin.37]
MTYRVDYRQYRRPFRRPIHTHHGLWTERKGLILRLTNRDGHIGLGEIAPLPNFGSESLAQAVEWCQSLEGRCTADTIRSIPTNLPACQFGFESAEHMITVSPPSSPIIPHPVSVVYCRLLPTGKSALTAWKPFYAQGDRTFKWKIGVDPIQTELALFNTLVYQLPPDVTVRLDANGGLSWDEAAQWLSVCDRLISMAPSIRPSPPIEFLEQPLPPTQFDPLLQLSRHYQTPIALDESVATLAQLQDCYQRGWRGVVVMKAAIAGYPSRIREFCRTHQLDVVWSSVFETAIARRYILDHLVPSISDNRAISHPKRAVGFGVQHYFADTVIDESGTHRDDLNSLFDHRNPS